MEVGTLVKYDGDHLGIFLYPHEREQEGEVLCSVLNRWTKRITHVNYKSIKIYEHVCWTCGHIVYSDEADICPICHWVVCPACKACRKARCSEDGIHIYDLEGWHEYNQVVEPEGEQNFWVKLDNHELVYKGEILDMEFEIIVEKLVNIGLEPVLVIDHKNLDVYIYADNLHAREFKEIVNEVNEDREDDVDYDYYGVDLFDIIPSGYEVL